MAQRPSHNHLVVDVSDEQMIVGNGETPVISPVESEGSLSDSNNEQIDHLDDLRLKVPLSSHCHNTNPRPHDKGAQRQMMVVTFLVIIFMIGEFTGGLIANSLAVMSDAAHMLVDLLSFLISLSAIWISRKPASRKFSFGYHRFEIIGALLSILIIWVLTAVLCYMAAMRIANGEIHSVVADPMLYTSCAGVLFNIIMALILQGTFSKCGLGGGGHGHSHGFGTSHGHSHGESHAHDDAEHGHGHEHGHNNNVSIDDEESREETSDVEQPNMRRRTISITAYPNEELSHVKKTQNINVRAAFIHVLGDLLQSVGVLVAAIIVKLRPDWGIADPICTFVFAVLVIITTTTVVRDVTNVLLETTPRDVDYAELKNDLMAIPGVKSVHSLHMWSLTMDKAAAAVHIAIDKIADPVATLQSATKIIRHKFNVTFTTVQVEPFEPSIMPICSDCLGPSK